MSKLKNLKGQTFGYLTVIKRVDNDYRGRAQWLCKCKCGNTHIVGCSNLTSGKTTSCGCKKFESHNKRHGYTKTDIYNKWLSMKQRCFDKNHHTYDRYGAKGITVCDEWLVFENFLEWSMKNGYQEKYSIDRIDNSKGYCPSNCRWIPLSMQSRNRTNNVNITINGETKTLVEWCEIYNAPYELVRNRYRNLGWDIITALTKPSRNHH